MSRPLGNQGFQQLRSWFFPGKAGSTNAPSQVSEVLSSIVDTERWVPIPRYGARIEIPAFGAATYSSLQMETFDVQGVGGDAFRPKKFVTSNIRVRTGANLQIARAYTRKNDGGFVGLSSLSDVWTAYATYSGDEPQVAWNAGSAPAGGLGMIVGIDWVDIPDVEPGNCVQFRSVNANVGISFDVLWSERRAIGYPGV